MEKIEPNIFRSEPFQLFEGGGKICSFFLCRPNGNILVYGGGNFRKTKEQIKDEGGISIQAISHRHETTRHPDWVRNEFGATRYCHKDELPAVPETFGIDVTFSEDTQITSDFFAIPTPGHCPGSSCFIWDDGETKYAFTGDTLFMKDGCWDVDVANGSPLDAAASLRKLTEHEFDAIVPGIYYDELDYMRVSSSQLKEEIGSLLERLEKECVQ
ncbi:MBL fold hydrolase [Tateyamaria omphalii]|uniref:MBL fold metallo-hydrolase n=1 Tax=Tateyamaria omphalii TaxID=299262 RepID=UPI001675F67B|nr:MBL fold metallo-hydrolase [Tateyamaria omphalii]GGX69997.1 MBL fold hydrolase [Tateyamaria omphalii]